MSIESVLSAAQAWHIEIGDVLDGLRKLPDNCIQCCVTSPPYYALRDYKERGQIGQEKTPQEYVAKLTDVFREVRRVLRKDGVCWLNLGDSYAGSGKGMGANGKTYGGSKQATNVGSVGIQERPPKASEIGYKRKELMGIPWRVAFALQDDGWYLRDDIIWHKPNPMPASVTDRTTKAHEYIFLLTKSAKYFYDSVAIAEPAVHAVESFTFTAPYKEARQLGRKGSGNEVNGKFVQQAGTRNKRSVWKIPLQPYKGSHFATFPMKLPTLCISAGTSERGCCKSCGAPYKRITTKEQLKRDRPNDYTKRTGEEGTGNSCANSVAGVAIETIGWEPTCKCNSETIPCLVLDIFNGAATTGVAALRLGRRYLGLELNPDYAALSRHRIENDKGEKPPKKPREKKVAIEPSPAKEFTTLFEM